MKKKKILGTLAVAGLATVALASCGKKKDKIYTIGVNAGTGATGVEAGTSYDVKDAAALVEALKSVTPVKKGYVFKGWYTTATYTTKLEAGVDISNVTTIFAKWEKADFTVTFDVKGNAHSNTATNTTTDVQFEDTVSPPNKDLIGVGLTENGSEMTFKGWELDGEAFKADTPITGNVTIKAVWEIVTIDTAQKFADYVNNEQKYNAEITADIDMTGTLVSRKAADYAEGSTAIKGGSELTTKFSNKIYGLDHTISNLKFESDLKNGGLWAKLGDGAAFSDITFKDCEFKGTNEKSAFIAGRMDIGANVSFTDVAFDGLTLNTVKYGSAFVSYVEGGKATFNGIYVDATGVYGQYNGLLVGSCKKNDKNPMTMDLEFTDCMVNGEMTSSSDSLGLYIGIIEQDANVEFTGCVAQGSIEATKNVGAFIGSAKKDNVQSIAFNKCIVTDANFEITDATNDKVNVFIGNVGNADYVTSYGNSVYREYGITLKSTKNGIQYPDQGEAAMNTSITAPCDNFVVSTDKTTGILSIGLKDTGAHSKEETYTIEATKDPTIDTITAVPTIYYEDKQASIKNDGSFKFGNVKLNYVYESAVGKAGNAIKVEIEAPAGVTDLTGYKINGDLEQIEVSGTKITGYIFITEEEYNAAVTASGSYETAVINRSATIEWYINAEHAAAPVEYKFVIQGLPASLPQPMTAGNITSEDTNITAATDTTVNTKLNVTAGTVDYDTTNKGNFITVKIAKPTAVASTANVEVTGSSAKVLEKGTDSITVQVKVAKGDNGITVNWDKTQYDAMNYVVNVADAVVFGEKPSTGETVTYNIDLKASSFTTSDTGAGDKEEAKDAVTSEMLGYDGFFTVNGKVQLRSKKTNNEYYSECTAIEAAMNDGLTFTVESAVTITLKLKSTSSSNKSIFVLKSGSNPVEASNKANLTPATAAGKYVITGESVTVTYTLQAGTYSMLFVDEKTAESDTKTVNRGGRFIEIKIVNAE